MNNKPLATAAWADPFEVTDGRPFAPGMFWLGRSPTDDARPLGYGDDRHICLVSGNRGGKGTTIIVPNLALWPGSVVVVDPKGENATLTACRRGPGSDCSDGMGQAVYVLDPFDAATVPDALRGRFNPLDALDLARKETIEEADCIADALVVISDGESKFWDEKARSMIKALILHVLTAEEYNGRRTLLTVRDLLMRGDAEKVDILKQMGETDIPSPHALLWEGVSTNTHFSGTLARIGSSFANMLEHSPKQYESVRQVADQNTEFMDSVGMQRCLEASDFKLSDIKLKPEGMSLYLSLPQRYMSTHYRWLRMMIALTLRDMEATPGQPATGHRVLLCLDEFAGLERMKVIENAVAQIAGYGVKLMFVLQSLEQLKATYKEKWETFLSNCGLKIFFGIEDYFTREYVSKFIGEEEIIRETKNENKSSGTQKGTTYTTSRQTSSTTGYQFSNSATDTETHSTQEGTSFQRGRSGGRSGGRNRGTNWSLNLGLNSNSGASWKPGLFFRGDQRKNDGGGWSGGASYGQQQGSNDGWNDGWNTAQGRQRGTGYSSAHAKGTSQSWNTSQSESVGTSEAKSFSETEQTTKGTAEGIHKRRLITEDEIGTHFKRIVDRDHPAYPGFALVLVSGEHPIFLRKANYFEDPAFIRGFDPHPDHQYLPLSECVVEVLGPEEAVFKQLCDSAVSPFRITTWLVAPGERVTTGSPLAEIEGDVFGKRTTTLNAPVAGWVDTLGRRRRFIADEGRLGPTDTSDPSSFSPREQFVALKHYANDGSPFGSTHAHALVNDAFLNEITQARAAAQERERKAAEDNRRRKEAEWATARDRCQEVVEKLKVEISGFLFWSAVGIYFAWRLLKDRPGPWTGADTFCLFVLACIVYGLIKTWGNLERIRAEIREVEARIFLLRRKLDEKCAPIAAQSK